MRTRRLITGLACVGLAAVAPAVGAQGGDDESTSWRPNLRIGPVVFNQPLPANGFATLQRGRRGYFTGTLRGSGARVRGYVFADPNDGHRGARAIWSTSKQLSYRGVRVGVSYATARRRLGRGWSVARHPQCTWLNSYRLESERTGPVSTQIYISRRTGRVNRIALNEITELDC